MKVEVRAGAIWCESGGGWSAPVASEVYSVIFEGAPALENTGVTAADLMDLGLAFQTSTALPVIVLRCEDTPNGSAIRWDLEGKLGVESRPVARAADRFLDYVLFGNRWTPLPFGSGSQASDFMVSLGAGPSGTLALTSYLKLLSRLPNGFEIRDETGNSLSAVELAHSLHQAPPAGFVGTLYPYQSSGVAWLRFMHEQGVGCILADEMGLGKSVQIVCLALHAATQPGAVLVVAPATLLENWRREFRKFAPSMTVLIHRGARRAGLAEEFGNFQVIVTSFETAVADISMLTAARWGLMVVDEAQGLKNPSARRTTTLKRIPRGTTVAVTGTPVENSLRDLWSLTDFVAPSILGTLAAFERLHPDSRDGAELVEPRVSPLILRRRVADVAKDLPDRIDVPVALELDDASVVEYERLRAEALQQYGRSGGLVALTRLRMFCAHPRLTGSGSKEADPASCSPKLERLLQMVEEIRSCAEKVLIFTPYSEAIDLLRAELDGTGLPVSTLDGRTAISERQNMVDAFSNIRGSAAMVMNPKAAGVGLNITAANHVIHHSPEWNPAVEDQASARSFRRGQDKNVRIYRFFYSGTVEELMHQRMTSKRELANTAVVGGDGRTIDLADIARALDISPKFS